MLSCFEFQVFFRWDMLHPKAVDKPSFPWMSIAHAVNALKTGFRWKIGMA